MKIRRSSILKVLLIPCLLTFMLAVFLLTFSVNVFAASDSSESSLPFQYSNVNYYNDWWEYNNLNSTILTAFENSNLPIHDPDYVLYLTNVYYYFTENGNPIYYSTYALVPISSFNGYTTNFYTNSLTYSLVSNKNYYTLGVYFNLNNTTPVSFTTLNTNPGSLNLSMFGSSRTSFTSLGATSLHYTLNVPLVFNSSFYDSNDHTILSINNLITVPEVSDPTAFDDSGLGLDNSIYNGTVPTVPTVPSPSFDPIPTWDSTQPLQSVFDILVWGFGIVRTLFNTFMTIVKDWFSFIGKLIGYVIGKIIDFIKAIVDWLYQQFLNWLNPYLQIINFIAHLLWSDDDQVSTFDNIISTINGIMSNSFFSDFWEDFKDALDEKFSNFSKIVLFFSSLIVVGTDPTTHEFSIPYLISYLFVPDTQTIVSLIIANDSLDLINTGKVIITSWQSMIGALIHVAPSPVIHVPSCIYHGEQIGDYDISFSWFNDYKLFYDILINGFLIIGYIYWIFVSFSHHMKGTFLPEYSDDYQRHNIGF